jgi:hypothetical protein
MDEGIHGAALRASHPGPGDRGWLPDSLLDSNCSPIMAGLFPVDHDLPFILAAKQANK